MEKKKINLHFEVIESPKQKRAKEKNENRRDLLLTIATFLVITSIIAGIHVCKIWYSPAPASDFDLFLFFYFIIGLALGLLIFGDVNFASNDKMGSWKWWYDNT